MNNFLKIFKERGYFYQSTDEAALENLMNKQKISAYIGFDCTAESLHVGSLMQIMILRLLQNLGHRPIIILGGATSKIGDPTGKDTMRKVLTNEQIKKNKDGIKYCLSKFLNFDNGDNSAILLDNSNWLENIYYLDVLKKYGDKFTINKMLTMESVKQRLNRNNPLTLIEFNYMILQAIDYLYLYENYDCLLQIGGSDQWGNIVMGMDLIHKVLGKKVYGLTTPLLTLASGKKMGKSEKGAIWINENMLSEYEYFQFWRNIPDNDVNKFAKLFCELSKTELDNFENLTLKDINSAKKDLAYRITNITHGEINAQKALDSSIKIFEKGINSEDMPQLNISKDNIKDGIKVYQILKDSSFVNSFSEAKRLIRGGAIKIEGNKINNDDESIDLEYFTKNNVITINVGKKRHLKIQLN